MSSQESVSSSVEQVFEPSHLFTKSMSLNISLLESKDCSLTNYATEEHLSAQPFPSLKRYRKKEDHNYELIPSDDNSESLTNEKRPSTPDVLSPFKICWNFGFNRMVPLLNITSSDMTAIVFTASHITVIYDYSNKTAQFLQGHKNKVNTLSVDQTGQWLVTADLGDDSSVIVWDTQNCTPVDTLFNVHKEGTEIVGMSPNAHYLVTISPWVEQKLQLFKWTLGNTQSDASLDVPIEYGPVRKLNFSPNCCEHFSLTTDSKIIFISYEDNVLHLHVGYNNLNMKEGQYTGSTYIPNTHLFLSATTTGYVFMWSDVDYDDSFNSFNVTNKKRVLKHIHLLKEEISYICTVDNVVAIVDCKGQITFYDRTLCILYWIKFYDPTPLYSLSFHLEPEKKYIFDSEREDIKPNEALKPISLNTSSDATLKRKYFFVRDFIFLTKKGKICYVNFTDKSIHDVFETDEEHFTAIDVMPGHNYLCCGNTGGYCRLYDYNEKKLIAKHLLMNADQLTQHSAINYVKYSPCGKELACGKTDGSLWILDPFLLKPKTNRSIMFAPAGISKIIFSYDSKYLAHSDYQQCISLYKLTEDAITLIGIYRAHNKAITDLMFLKVTSLFSIGEDGQLVEFDIAKSCAENTLVLESVHTIEQTAIPLCMMLYPLSKVEENLILTANSEFKFKLIQDSNKKCCLTAITHILSSPISFIEILPSNSYYLIFATENHIGIQKLPPDGNPYKTLAVTGSPRRICNICISSQGNYLFTLDVDGHNILMWNINTKCVDYFEWTGGKHLEPYYEMIQGGRKGYLWREIIDYFCVAQILHQGENSSITKTLSNEIPICELSDIMRAVGFFPTEQEIYNLYYEVLTNIQSKSNVNNKHSIKFNDFVRLYINHRSTRGLTKQQLEDAFLMLSSKKLGEETSVLKNVLQNILRTKGEFMRNKEMIRCFSVLCGQPIKARLKSDGDSLLPFLPPEISFNYFFNTVLGFNEEILETKEEDESLNQ